MIALVETLNADFAKCAPNYINDPKKAVYRIYRDVRFSSDKSPYKTHLAAAFPRRGGDKQSSAGFYFHVSAKGVGVAGGLWEPPPEQLLAVRTWLVENHAKFRKASRSPEKLMGKLHGEALQRIPKGLSDRSPGDGSDQDEALGVLHHARTGVHYFTEAGPRIDEALSGDAADARAIE